MSKTIGEALGSVFGPRPTPKGEGYEFNLLFHEHYVDSHEGYRAWWEGIDDVERAGHQRSLDTRDRIERERAAEKRRREEAEEAADKERARLAPLVRMRRRGVPAKDHEAIARGELDGTPAMEAARSLLAGDMRVLVLSGPKGCGKTTAAAWLAAQDVTARLPGDREDDRRAPEPMFLDVSKLARLSRYKAEDVEPLESCSLLVIDDLGMEYADEKGSFLATLDGIFNARYAAGLYTVITTNLPAKTFKERYGERIADRIREVGRFVELNGKSLRGRGARGQEP